MQHAVRYILQYTLESPLVLGILPVPSSRSVYEKNHRGRIDLNGYRRTLTFGVSPTPKVSPWNVHKKTIEVSKTSTVIVES
ncbi:hypothetical protein SAMN05192553_102649 [Cyclobacterium xiamenense]|uniref:Uncharacterized protein n=1 Tax=Cyclobacterium xiamenense TaxID=1297121 RepID=A0A1H6WS38_9BACT|nr:hypothetical protein SAMN05192553_102649 [Cyclobacterium xiamenense]